MGYDPRHRFNLFVKLFLCFFGLQQTPKSALQAARRA
jgi:hypothetical protein